MFQPPKTYPKSQAWFERASRVLSGGVSSQFRRGEPHPMFYERALGSRIWDADGNELLDFTLAQGPCILGYSHPELLSRVHAALQKGQLFAGQHEEEVLLAEALQRLIPCAERVRFSSTGSEAVHTTLRLARYLTGRAKFIKFEGHYHGWLDNVSFGVNAPAAGVSSGPAPWGGGLPESAREDVIVLPWNDLECVEKTLAQRGHEIGALITEPVMANQGCIEPAPGFLAGLRELCDRYGVLLIFDEIITGFRLDLGGAGRYYGVVPDLAVFGKALASGFPLSAVVGRAHAMKPLETGAVYHAGTLNGNHASVAAALATVEVLERDNGEALQQLCRTGVALQEGLREVAARVSPDFRVQGPGPLFHAGFSPHETVASFHETLTFDRPRYTLFCTKMLERGVRLIGRGLWYVSAAHSEADLEQALEAAEGALRERATAPRVA